MGKTLGYRLLHSAALKKLHKKSEQNSLTHRLIVHPRYDSGRTHPYHPNCARFFSTDEQQELPAAEWAR